MNLELSSATPPFAAIVFDMDGVVIDSEPIHDQSHRIIFGLHDLPVPAEAYPSFKGIPERKLFERVVSEFGSDEHDVDTLTVSKEETFLSLMPDMRPIPGALDFIRLAKSQTRLALTTSATSRYQRFAFDRFDLDRFFEVVVTAEDIHRHKPDPEPYQETAKRLGLAPEMCLVIEDSVNGVRSAQRAGCHVAGITTSFSAGELKEAGAHIVVDTFEELAERLGMGKNGAARTAG